MIGYIHSFESFGTLDGPGTRFVIFLQGCPLRCQYCHNPDSWKYQAGQQMTVEEVMDKYLEIQSFVKSGITISGGEPLAQLDFVLEFVKLAKKHDIHVCIDTSGYLFNPDHPTLKAKYDELILYVDLFLLDIKAINPILHKDLVGVDNTRIIQFARYLDEHHRPIWIRHVVVPGLTYNDVSLVEVAKFIASLSNVEKLELLPFHQMGTVKYETLNIDYPLKDLEPLNTSELTRARKIVELVIKTQRQKDQ